MAPRSPRTAQSRSAQPRADIREVARRARVSIATVSRTMNNVPSVNQDLARRVWKAIEELQYFPNTQARSLVSGRSRIFGLIVSEITNPFFPELIQRFEEIAVRHGYEMLVSSTNYDPQRMNLCIRRMLERKVEGVAIMTFGIEQPLVHQLAERNVPLVFVDIGPDSPRITNLSVNYRMGIREGVQHLAALGHRSIAFVTGPPHLHSARMRHAAFIESMKEIGIAVDPKFVAEGDHTLDGGMQAMDKLLALKTRPTAVMASNDMTAVGILRAILHAGLAVPDEISVIGFDDIHITEFTVPALTTVQMSRTDLAHAAFNALLAHVDNEVGNPAPREIIIPTRLIVRESTGFPTTSLRDLKPHGKRPRAARSASSQ